MSSPEEVKPRERLFSLSSAPSTDLTLTSAQQQDLRAASKGMSSALGWKGGRGRPWRNAFSRKLRCHKRAIICAPWKSPMMAHHLAAVEIQRRLRGFVIRARIRRDEHGTINEFDREDLREHNVGLDGNSNGVQRTIAANKRRISGRRRSRTDPQLDKYLRCFGEGGWGEDGLGRVARPGGYSEWCTVRIQAWWRMILVRFEFRYIRFPVYGLAAMQIQCAWKSYQQNKIYDMSTSHEIGDGGIGSLLDTNSEGSGPGRGPSSSIRQTRHARHSADPESQEEGDSEWDLAAKMIQGCWRRRVSQSIYRYYRNIVDFRLGGDPRLLLRAINPGEASMFDRAAGVHVRFRLGGFSFPPSIYYKVYTHQPVADIGAFAPRSYVEDTKQTPGERWNHPSGTTDDSSHSTGQIRVGASYFGTAVNGTGPQGTKNWYRRHENNGWRPITIKALSSAENDPVTIATSSGGGGGGGAGGTSDRSPGGGFHFSRLVREECRVARTKQRKRRWLMSMYKAGLAGGAAAATAQPNNGSQPVRDSNGCWDKVTDEDQGRGPGPGQNGGGAKVRQQVDEFWGEQHGGNHPVADSRNCRTIAAAPGFDEADDGFDCGGEVDSHLRWSEGLDFTAYISEWRQMATSGPSEPWKNADGLAVALVSATMENHQRGDRDQRCPFPAFTSATVGRGDGTIGWGDTSGNGYNGEGRVAGHARLAGWETKGCTGRKSGVNQQQGSHQSRATTFDLGSAQ